MNKSITENFDKTKDALKTFQINSFTERGYMEFLCQADIRSARIALCRDTMRGLSGPAYKGVRKFDPNGEELHQNITRYGK